MCLITLALNVHPDFPLVVVANRDEFFDRATDPLDWWPDRPDLLAGRDRREGGTWMGLNRQGLWGAVTNYREGVYTTAALSRGFLVRDYLSTVLSPVDYLESLAPNGQQYGGFSVLLGCLIPKAISLYYYTNRHAGIQQVADGIHTLSNHRLDTPWPKCELASLKLRHALMSRNLEPDELFAVLSDHQPFEDHELPVTGVGIELERVLSPPFIVGEGYGTRSTSVLTVDTSGAVVFAERQFLPGGKTGGQVSYEVKT